MKFKAYFASFLCFYLLTGLEATAESISFVDQNNQPLAQVVLELRTTSNTLKPTQTYVIDQVDKLFVPDFLIIPTGAKVEFPNQDNIRHHVYSFSKAKPFELKLYSGKPEAPIDFPQSGVVVLGCNIHDTMVGHIYITESRYTFASNNQGRLDFTIPDDVTTATIWHKNQAEGPEVRKEIDVKALLSNQQIIIKTVEQEPADTFQNLFKNAQN